MKERKVHVRYLQSDDLELSMPVFATRVTMNPPMTMEIDLASYGKTVPWIRKIQEFVSKGEGMSCPKMSSQ